MTPLLAERVIESARAAARAEEGRPCANNVRTSNVPRKCQRVTAVCCIDKPNGGFPRASTKPSNGLEPSTPSLPSCAITRDTVFPANRPSLDVSDASRGVARVVSEVSVSYQRLGALSDNGLTPAARVFRRSTSPQSPRSDGAGRAAPSSSSLVPPCGVAAYPTGVNPSFADGTHSSW
jgi:hypothetical protein